MWRRSWKRIRGSPAFVRKFANDRRRLLASTGLPKSLVKTRPIGSSHPALARRSAGVPSGMAPKRAHGGSGKLKLAPRTGGLRLADGSGCRPVASTACR